MLPPTREPLSHGLSTLCCVAAHKIWTAEQLERLSPNETRCSVRACFETSLENVSPMLLERARRKVEAHIAANEGSAAVER